jgi:hypothetical protein
MTLRPLVRLIALGAEIAENPLLDPGFDVPRVFADSDNLLQVVDDLTGLVFLF